VIESLSNPAHIHLLLNHVPTVGFGLGLALFFVAFARRNDDLKRTSLVILFVVAVTAIATYLSGPAAEDRLREVPIVSSTAASPTVITTRWPHGLADGSSVDIQGHVGSTPSLDGQKLATVISPTEFSIPVDVTQGGTGGTLTHAATPYAPGIIPPMIRAHEDAALVAFAFMEITGFLAWLALWHWRRVTDLPGWMLPMVLLLSVVTFGLMARAATLGGEINHQEIRLVQEAAAGAGRVQQISLWVMGTSWVWPTCETLHFIGLSLLFTVVLIVDLRMLGMIKNVSYSAVYQLLPIGMLGFGLNLITGLMFFIGIPAQYTHNKMFYWKIVCVVLGGLNVVYFMLFDEAWAVGPGDDAPTTAKIAAASAIVIWASVLFCGHMLPFIGNAF